MLFRPRLKIFLGIFADYRVLRFCFRTYLVSGWCKSNFGASLRALKPDMTHITSCRNVFSIEHTASAVFVALWLVLPFRQMGLLYGLDKNIIELYLQIFNTQNYILFNISASGLFLKCSLDFAKFSLDIPIKYSYIKNKV